MRFFWASAAASFWATATAYVFVGFVMWDWSWISDISTWHPSLRALFLFVTLGICVIVSIISSAIIDAHFKSTVKKNVKAKADYVRR